jgi:hypothetical protein
MEMKRKINIIKYPCPSCKCDLHKEGIGQAINGTMFYECFIEKYNKKEYLGYQQDEFESQGECDFYCRKCGETLPKMTEDQVLEILKGE